MHIKDVQKTIRNAIAAHALFAADAAASVLVDLGHVSAAVEAALEPAAKGYAITVWPPVRGNSSGEMVGVDGVDSMCVVRFAVNPAKLTALEAASVALGSVPSIDDTEDAEEFYEVPNPPQPYYGFNVNHKIRVWAFKNKAGSGPDNREYSPAYAEGQKLGDNNNSGTYRVHWTWPAVAGADGYRVLKYAQSDGLETPQHNFDVGTDVATNELLDYESTWGADGTMTNVLPASVAGPTASDWLNDRLKAIFDSVLGVPEENNTTRFQLSADAFELVNFDDELLAYHLRFARFLTFGT